MASVVKDDGPDDDILELTDVVANDGLDDDILELTDVVQDQVETKLDIEIGEDDEKLVSEEVEKVSVATMHGLTDALARASVKPCMVATLTFSTSSETSFSSSSPISISSFVST